MKSEAVIFSPDQSQGLACLPHVFCYRVKRRTWASSTDFHDETLNRCSYRGASGTDFQTNNPESYFGDGRLSGLDLSRKIGSGDPSSSRKIASVGRESDCDLMICRVFGNSRRSDRKACRGVYRGICDCGRVCKRMKSSIIEINIPSAIHSIYVPAKN